jgi:hypothetical protein
MNGCDPKGACRSRQPTQGLRLAEPVNPGRVARAKRSLPVFVLGEDQSKTRPAGQRLDTHQRSGQSQGIAPTSPAQRRAESQSASGGCRGFGGVHQFQVVFARLALRTAEAIRYGAMAPATHACFLDSRFRGNDMKRPAVISVRNLPFWTRQCYSTYN